MIQFSAFKQRPTKFTIQSGIGMDMYNLYKGGYHF